MKAVICAGATPQRPAFITLGMLWKNQTRAGRMHTKPDLSSAQEDNVWVLWTLTGICNPVPFLPID